MADENSHSVSYGRWEAEHHALVERVYNLEQQAVTLRNAEAVHASFDNRLTDLEHLSREELSRGRGRRDRAWLIVLGVMSGVVCPLLLTAIFTLLHLRSTG